MGVVERRGAAGEGPGHGVELGLLVEGGDIPRRVDAHLSALIAAGVLRPLPALPGYKPAPWGPCEHLVQPASGLRILHLAPILFI